MDDDGFTQYAESRLTHLSKVAYLLTGNHAAAEDLVQSALEKVAQHWKRVSASDSPDAYVRTLLYHEHVSIWRRHRRELPTEEVPDVHTGGDEADAAVRRVVTQRALARLTPRQRAVIVLRFFEDLSVAETAAALGCTNGTVKSQTSHALARLRELAPELEDLVNGGALV